MPSNDLFSFSILVGEKAVPEYQHDDETLIESNLFTKNSYQVQDGEGEEECQKVPVTPYEVLLKLFSNASTPCWCYIFVDGVKVRQCVLKPGETRTIKGFKDKGEIKEFLFSLPRFNTSEDDRISGIRGSKVGKIEIEMREAVFCGSEFRYPKIKHFAFKQAGKKDCAIATRGRYTMSTTRLGRRLEAEPYKMKKYTNWSNGSLLRTLAVRYHMHHTLADMGIRVVSY